MNGKMKKIAMTALVLGVLAITFLASPIQGYMNNSGDLLKTQDRDRDELTTHEQKCDDCPLQTQARDQLRTEEQDCDCDGSQKQNKYGEEENEVATNGSRDCSMEQFRYQHRERIGT
jgi:hypothetical protein